MAFGIGNIGGSGGSMDVDFGTGRDGELFIDVSQTVTLPVTAETGFIDKHYTTGYIDVNGILKPQARNRYTVLRFTGDLTIRGTLDWSGSGGLNDFSYPCIPGMTVLGAYDAVERPFLRNAILNLYGDKNLIGGSGGKGGNGGNYTTSAPPNTGGIGSMGAAGHPFGGGAGGNGGSNVYTNGTPVICGTNGIAPSNSRHLSITYGVSGGKQIQDGGGVAGPGAGGLSQYAGAYTAGSAYGGGCLIIFVGGNVQITSSGIIRSNGGNGSPGQNTPGTGGIGTTGSGGGAGGGGGIIVMLHTGAYENSGSVTANGGAGGSPGTSSYGSSYVGGSGGAGEVGSILIKKVA